MKLPAIFKRKTAADRMSDREAARAVAAAPAAPKKPLVDFAQILDDFKTLDPKDPGLWPLAPRALILFGLFAALVTAGWWFGWNVQMEELAQKETEETKLKEEWVSKKQQAINLDAHKAQLAAIDNSFGILLRQLPNQSEIGDLLVDINKAAQSRGLTVELFKPGGESPKGFYAEVPINLQLMGNYHDMGAFAGDIAQLPRIVTLNDLEISSGAKGEILSIKTTAKTFRYLDESELAKQRKSEKEKRTGTKK
jgi:type IV pilus assembly protein PilO